MPNHFPHSGNPRSGAQTAARAIDLLMVVAHEGRPLTLVELSRRTGINLSSTHRLMQTLGAKALVAREPSGRRYVVGGGLVALSAVVAQGTAVKDLASSFVSELAQMTSETAAFHLRSRDHRVAIYAVDGIHPVRRVVTIGERVPLHVGATGITIMAYMPQADRDRLLSLAEARQIDLAYLYASLELAERTGYLAAIGSRTPGVGGIAAPVFDTTGVIGALTVSGPQERWNQEAMDLAGPDLLRVADALSAVLGGSRRNEAALSSPDARSLSVSAATVAAPSAKRRRVSTPATQGV